MHICSLGHGAAAVIKSSAPRHGSWIPHSQTQRLDLLMLNCTITHRSHRAKNVSLTFAAFIWTLHALPVIMSACISFYNLNTFIITPNNNEGVTEIFLFCVQMFVLLPKAVSHVIYPLTILFPENMKIARVIHLLKNGNKCVFTNYRPISSLPEF